MADDYLKVEDNDLEEIKRHIDEAIEEESKLRELRLRGYNSYHRQPLGNERKNRSQFISSAAGNVVDSVMPHLAKRFMGSTHGIDVSGPNNDIAGALQVKCFDVITEQGGFRFIYDTLKHGLVDDNGSAKVYWKNVFEQSIEVERDGLTAEQLGRLRVDPEIEILEEEVQGMLPMPTGRIDMITGMPLMRPMPVYRAAMKYSKIKATGPVLDVMPPDEFLPSRYKRRINDRHPVGHRKWMTIGELKQAAEQYGDPDSPYYRNLELVAQERAGRLDTNEKDTERFDRERPFYDTGDGPIAGNDVTGSDLRKEVEVVEWYDHVIQRGELCPAILTFAGGVPIRIEKNDDGLLPFCTWSPIINPGRLIGTSLATNHSDLHDLETMMVRSLLDSVAFSIDKPRIVRSASADLLGMQNLYPGRLIVGNPDDVRDIDISPIDNRLFEIIEYLKSEQENRGPITRYNQGSDAGSLNKTATGVSLIQQAAFTRIDLIALTYAEEFLADLYSKIIRLYQKNMIQPEVVIVAGKKVQLSPEGIQGDYKAGINMGIEVDFNEKEYMKSQALLKMAMELAGPIPWLYPMEKIYNHVRKVYVSAGYRDTDEYIAAPAQGTENFISGKGGAKPAPTSPQSEISTGQTNATPDESLLQTGGVT